MILWLRRVASPLVAEWYEDDTRPLWTHMRFTEDDAPVQVELGEVEGSEGDLLPVMMTEPHENPSGKRSLIACWQQGS